VELENKRIDRALNAIWPKVVNGDFKAIGVMDRLMQRRAKLLGLDKPEKKLINFSEMSDEELLSFISGGDPEPPEDFDEQDQM